MSFPPLPDLGADGLEQRQLALWKQEGLVPAHAGSQPRRHALRVLRGTADRQWAAGHSSRVRPDDQGPGLPFPRDAGEVGHPDRGVGHARPAGRDRSREGAEAQRQEGDRGVRRGGVQRACPPERVQVSGGVGIPLRPHRLLARLRPSLRHLQQLLRRVGLVAAGTAARARPAVPGPSRAPVLPPLRHRALEPRARAGVRGRDHQLGVRHLPAGRRLGTRAPGLDHDPVDPRIQRGRGRASGPGIRRVRGRRSPPDPRDLTGRAAEQLREGCAELRGHRAAADVPGSGAGRAPLPPSARCRGLAGRPGLEGGRAGWVRDRG